MALSQITNTIDQFNPSGASGFSYSGGQIGSLWTNWFGTAFQSIVWDSASDANSNAASGSMKITANFNGSSNQFEVYDGFSGIFPPLNGLYYTNFQCDVRFAAGSATGGFSGGQYFGYLQFGVSTPSFGQDYFSTAVNVPASNTNWVHVSIPINAVADTNLNLIGDLLVHIYGPNYSPALSGQTTFWVDNIQFVGPTESGQCVVDWNATGQRIDGFGASSAWDGSWNHSQANLLFSTNLAMPFTNSVGVKSTNNGVGLSLIRSRIVNAGNTLATSTPTTVETSIMQMAQALGARVWSTPWTPPAGFKSTNDIYDSGKATGGGINGGSFLGSGNNITNINYASQLANYVVSMKNTYGVNLYAISIQNEPDADVTSYEACQWSASQIHDFVTNLYSALAAKGVGSTKIILPEDENWRTNLVQAAMSDPIVAQDVGVVACHNYDGSPAEAMPAPLSTFSNPNAATWETEAALLSGSDVSTANGVFWAERVHYFMTVAQANAWHYWWLWTENGSSSQALTDANGSPTKRMFALGQFSRFVRPNFYRIGANNNCGTLISAYKDSVSPNFAIVAINPFPANVPQTFTLTNLSGASVVTPWITSSNLSLAPQSAVAVTNLSFTYNLPPMSIVTFAGQATIASPSITSFAISGPTITLTANGPQGPNYTLLMSTNLVNWQTVLTTNSPALPVTLTYSNSPPAVDRFFRLELGP